MSAAGDGSNGGGKRARDATEDGGGKRAKKQPEVIKGAWSPEEDEAMKKAVEKFGQDWKAVSTMVVGRTSKQCRDRYKLKLDPSINHGPWTPEEDQRLLELKDDLGRQWTKIAQLMPGRTENSVKSRHASLERSRNREWTDDEDMILRSCRERNLSFQAISDRYLTKRSEHAVKKRWEKLFMSDLAEKIRNELPNTGGAPRPAAAPVAAPQAGPPPTEAAGPPLAPPGPIHVRQGGSAESISPSPLPPPLQPGQVVGGQHQGEYDGGQGYAETGGMAEASSASNIMPLPLSPPSAYQSAPPQTELPPPSDASQPGPGQQQQQQQQQPSDLGPPLLAPMVRSEHPFQFPGDAGAPEGIRVSRRTGNIKRQTTSVTVLQQIIGEPLKNNL